MTVVIPLETLSQNQTIPAQFYGKQLDPLQKRLREKRFSLVNQKEVTFYLNYAKAHSAKIMTTRKIKNLAEEGITFPIFS